MSQRPIYYDSRDKKRVQSFNFDQQALRDSTEIRKGIYIQTAKGKHLREELMSEDELEEFEKKRNSMHMSDINPNWKKTRKRTTSFPMKKQMGRVSHEDRNVKYPSYMLARGGRHVLQRVSKLSLDQNEHERCSKLRHRSGYFDDSMGQVSQSMLSRFRYK